MSRIPTLLVAIGAATALSACAHDPGYGGQAYYDSYGDTPPNYEEPRCDRVYDNRNCERYYERKAKPQPATAY